jgi:hypothetical protein
MSERSSAVPHMFVVYMPITGPLSGVHLSNSAVFPRLPLQKKKSLTRLELLATF